MLESSTAMCCSFQVLLDSYYAEFTVASKTSVLYTHGFYLPFDSTEHLRIAQEFAEVDMEHMSWLF